MSYNIIDCQKTALEVIRKKAAIIKFQRCLTNFKNRFIFKRGCIV